MRTTIPIKDFTNLQFGNNKTVSATASAEHSGASGQRQLRSRRSTKLAPETAFGSQKALACFYDLICHLFVVEGSRVEFLVDGLPVPTFRSFKREWRPGSPFVGIYCTKEVTVRLRLDTLPLGRVLGLRELRRRVNSFFSRRSSIRGSRSIKFVSGGFVDFSQSSDVRPGAPSTFVVPNIKTKRTLKKSKTTSDIKQSKKQNEKSNNHKPFVPTCRSARAVACGGDKKFFSSLAGLELDSRVAGTRLASPVMEVLASLPERPFGVRLDLPAEYLPLRESSELFACVTQGWGPVPPQCPRRVPYVHSGHSDFIVHSAINSSATRFTTTFDNLSASQFFKQGSNEPEVESSVDDPFAAFERDNCSD